MFWHNLFGRSRVERPDRTFRPALEPLEAREVLAAPSLTPLGGLPPDLQQVAQTIQEAIQRQIALYQAAYQAGVDQANLSIEGNATSTATHILADISVVSTATLIETGLSLPPLSAFVPLPYPQLFAAGMYSAALNDFWNTLTSSPHSSSASQLQSSGVGYGYGFGGLGGLPVGLGGGGGGFGFGFGGGGGGGFGF